MQICVALKTVILCLIAGVCHGQYAETLNTGPLIPTFYPQKVSVVLPCYNCAKTIRATCKSIEESLVVFLTRNAVYPTLSIEIVFVDDKSSDNSIEIIEDISRGKTFYRIIKHEVNKGPGPARNTGANAATGDILLFGDADDDFLPHHVSTCFEMFVRLPNDGFIRTRIDAGPSFHPHWQMAVEDSIPLNLCVRRHAHHFIGGFPENPEFKDDLEDVAYVKWLYEMYAGSKSLSVSVEYKRYEGNMLDKRMQQFSKPPEEVYQSPDDKELNDLRFKLIDQHISELTEEVGDYLDADLLMHAHPLDKFIVSLSKEREQKYGRAYPIPQAEYSSSLPFVGVVMPCMPRAINSVLYTLVYESKMNPFRVVFFYDSRRCTGAGTLAARFPVHVVDIADENFPGILRWALLHCPVAAQIRRMAIFAWKLSADAAADLALFDTPVHDSIHDQTKMFAEKGVRLAVVEAAKHVEPARKREIQRRRTGDYPVRSSAIPACDEIRQELKGLRTLVAKFHCWSVTRQ